MTVRCFVLAKISPSYSYIDSYKVQEGSTVASVSDAAKELASKYYHWNQDAARVRVKVYEPTQSLGVEKAKTNIKHHFQGIINDEYLETKCCRVISEFDPSQESLIAIATLSFEYIVFELIGGQNHPTCFLKGEVEDSMPSEVVRLVQKIVRQTAEKRLEAVKRGVSVIDVYETIHARGFYEGELPGNEPRTSMELLTPTIGEPGAPRGKGCLFVDLLTHTYIEFEYHLFKEEAVREYTFVATGRTKGLPRQTVKVIKEGAWGFIADELGNVDSRGANTHVSAYGIKDKARDGAILNEGNPQLTAADLRSLAKYTSATTLDRVVQHVVLIFELPAPIREEGLSTDRTALAKLARKRESPSAGAKLSALLANQREERKDAVYNNRPDTLAGPPVQIYNSAFATFIREMSHPHGDIEFSKEELERSLHFIDISLLLYTTERDRRAKTNELRVLGNIISSEVSVDGRSIFPDGTTTVICPSGEQEAVVRIVEVRNEVGEGGSDPIMQAECGFVLICSSDKYKPFRDASCCPMFLVGLAGPHLTVSGAIFAERYVSQRLTNYVYLGPLPTSHERSPADDSVRRVAQVLRALRKGTDELIKYYEGLQFKSPSTSLQHFATLRDPTPPLPIPVEPIPDVVPPSFRCYTADDIRYTVQYNRRLAPSFPAKAVFQATAIRNDNRAKFDVVVKFTHTYCEDAHRRLAEVARAPRLLFCNREESVGMYVVVMDYEDGKQVNKPLEDDDHIAQLQGSAETLHNAGYVHGDLRGPNILITAQGLKIIDFDWCGKKGEARYPADISLVPGIRWHDEVERGGIITEEHDNYMVGLLVSDSS